MTVQARATKEKSASARTTVSGKSAGRRGRATTSKAGTSPSKATQSKTAQSKAAQSKAAQSKTSQAKAPTGRTSAARAATMDRGTTVPLPVVTPHLKVYKFRVPTPGMSYVADAGHVVAGYLPPPERLAFYGGLGVAAVFGVIDWPVAAAIGVGAAIARRATRGDGGVRAGQRRAGAKS